VSFQRVEFTEEAENDLQDLRRHDPRLVVEALRVAKGVDEGRVSGKRLRYYNKTGDLTDCFRVYFGAVPGADTHRIVFREAGGAAEVVEVVAVAERNADVAYLLAALRLERLDDPVRRADARRGIAQARKNQPT
jgi:hypothetical protein